MSRSSLYFEASSEQHVLLHSALHQQLADQAGVKWSLVVNRQYPKMRYHVTTRQLSQGARR